MKGEASLLDALRRMIDGRHWTPEVLRQTADISAQGLASDYGLDVDTVKRLITNLATELESKKIPRA